MIGPPPALRRRALLGALAVATTSACNRAADPAGRTGGETDGGPWQPTSTSTLARVPDVSVGPVERHEFTSAAMRGARVRWCLMRPPGVRGRVPVAVALHGHGGTAASLAGEPVHLARWLAAAVADGVPPFAIAAISGGNGFWHTRPDGVDPGALVTDELLPRLADHDHVALGARGRRRRCALLGWSMGGYGALHLGGLLGPDRVAGIAAGSPGLYLDPAAAHPDGFADAAEYERYSVMGRQAELADLPTRVSIGTFDRFFPATLRYVRGFPPGAPLDLHVGVGGHTLGFTFGQLPADLRFVGEALAS